MSVIQPLNLPKAALNLEKINDQIFVWCIVRKKRLLLTPEEWVRQHFMHYLISTVQIPIERIVSEYGIEVNGLTRRCDIVVLDKNGKSKLIVECKATSIPINKEVLYQIAQYNRKLQVNYLVLSNGITHLITKVNFETGQLETLDELKKEWLD